MSHNVCLHLISFFAHYRQCDWIWWYSSVFSSTPLRCIACCPNSKVPEAVDHVLYTALSYLLSLNKSLIVQSNLLLYYLSLECILMKKMQFWHFFGFTSQQEVMLLGNISPKSDSDSVWLFSLFQNLSIRRTGLLSLQRRSGARQFAVTSAKLVRTMLWTTSVVALEMEDRGAARCPHRFRALCGRNSQMCGTAGCWRISALTSASTRRWGSGGEEMIMHGREAP